MADRPDRLIHPAPAARVRDHPGRGRGGKSTLAAHLAGTRPWLCHFTRLPGGRAPEAAQEPGRAVDRRVGPAQLGAGRSAARPSSRPDRFSRLLDAVAPKRDQQQPDEQHRKPIVMVADGLDEAEPETGGGGGLQLGLPESLLDGVCVVATSRFGWVLLLVGR
jgi:hypothetical protein